ncbi:hypothetical protein BD779DRAFT_1482309 [Infundibulicybe gibba]|nr:hypothetical protein BD779DRAFT_1482309 [Infundibulicybe gibba]
MPFSARSAFKIEAGTGWTKAGLTQPDVEYTLHADIWAQYIVHHGRLGGDNQVQGIVVNHAFHVHCRSTFGYALARAMAPREVKNGGPTLNKGITSTRTNFLRLFTILVAKPQLYREYITEWEQDMGETFTPIPTNAGEITITRIPVNEGGGANLTVDDIARLLIKNKIPPSWVDHAYTYGLYFLDYHIKCIPLDVRMFIEADNERLRRLAEYGEPPTIRAWDGWYIPSEHNKLRIHHLLDDKRQKKKIDSLIDSDWLFIGEEVLPIYLRHCKARQAAHVLLTGLEGVQRSTHAPVSRRIHSLATSLRMSMDMANTVARVEGTWAGCWPPESTKGGSSTYLFKPWILIHERVKWQWWWRRYHHCGNHTPRPPFSLATSLRTSMDTANAVARVGGGVHELGAGCPSQRQGRRAMGGDGGETAWSSWLSRRSSVICDECNLRVQYTTQGSSDGCGGNENRCCSGEGVNASRRAIAAAACRNDGIVEAGGMKGGGANLSAMLKGNDWRQHVMTMALLRRGHESCPSPVAQVSSTLHFY